MTAGGALTLKMSVTQTTEYDVRHVERYVFDPNENALAEAIGDRRAMFFIDEVLAPGHEPAIREYARRRLSGIHVVELSGDESEKSFATLERICRVANESRMPRDGVFVAVGGGVILDVVGFAASVYRRGVPFVRVATTLMGMVDVAVGIKQAVNFEGKNRLGSFYPAATNINDTRFLRSLPRRHISCGLAEIVKIAIVADARLFELVEEHGRALLDSAFRAPAEAAHEIVVRAEVAMMRELEPNLYEHGKRRAADFGHTFGPSFETDSEYAINHGESVALDMLVSTAIATARGTCDRGLLARMIALYDAVELPVAHPVVTRERLLRAMAEARANRNGALNLVLPSDTLGVAAYAEDVAPEELDAAIDAVMQSRSRSIA